MHYANAPLLLLLWLLPVLGLFCAWALRRRTRLLARFCAATLSPQLLPPGHRRRHRTAALLYILAIGMLVIALARPRWGFHWEEVQRRGVDILVAVDVSASMDARDIDPSRLERAKREVYDLARMLTGDRIGLIAFAGTAFVQCPLTLDYGAFQMFLDHLSPDLIPVPGTAIGDAIDTAIDAFTRLGQAERALILITDGEDHHSAPLEAAARARQQHIRIFTIGIGSPDGTPIPRGDSAGFVKDRQGNVVMSRLDESVLQRIARATGGSYVRSSSGDMDLDLIYRQQIKGTMSPTELQATRTRHWEERFQWFVAAALLLLAAESLSRSRTVLTNGDTDDRP